MCYVQRSIYFCCFLLTRRSLGINYPLIPCQGFSGEGGGTCAQKTWRLPVVLLTELLYLFITNGNRLLSVLLLAQITLYLNPCWRPRRCHLTACFGTVQQLFEWSCFTDLQNDTSVLQTKCLYTTSFFCLLTTSCKSRWEYPFPQDQQWHTLTRFKRL